MSLDLCLVRHGESESNAGLATADPRLAALTPRGLHEANAVAAALNTVPTLFIVSPYRRAQETAAPSCARFPTIPVETWPVQEFTFLSSERFQHTTLQDRAPAAAEYWRSADPHHRAADDAESFAEFVARVVTARLRLDAMPSGRVVMFTHKKFISALLWMWLSGVQQPTSRRMTRFKGFDKALTIPNGAFVRVRIRDGSAWVGTVDTTHCGGVIA